jgi:hypothetical protein
MGGLLPDGGVQPDVRKAVSLPMDAHVEWATYSHQTKSASWVIARYFDKVKRPGKTDWVFGDRQSGAYLHRFA